ncbi:probable zinc metalloprotease EGY3, chloroplastic isoform X1 [Hordeum vulgare subsp. vulgare]|uniref:probable zinc metalloprotease EGY3, chloroplastic isoform X1 n=1 Tax=Hordeum vulgare subsp. vulgare TaxID=112509 RepID=UPI001D1A3D6A|nr:probable zinc metalloprotease EGY3, chloroplastic isoform X1 [Hordeum vulgare subsp. vulgare]
MASTSLVASIVCSSSGSSSTGRSAALPRSFCRNHHRLSLRPLRSSSIVRCSLQKQDQAKENRPVSSIAVAPDEQKVEESKKASSHHAGGGGGGDHPEGGDGEDSEKKSRDEQQEVDWRSDEEFKKFMGNPSIEAAIKLEKKRADRKLRELDREPDASPISGLLRGFIKGTLEREKQRLEEAEQTFKALDLNKLKSCFGYDTFFAVDVRRFGDGGIFIGNLRKPIEEVRSKLEKKIAETAGTEVTLWFMEERNEDITKQVCMVQPKAEIELQLEMTKLSTPWGYLSAVALAVTTFGTIALMSGFFLKPGASFDDYVSDVLPLFGGFLSILGVSEVPHLCTRRHVLLMKRCFLLMILGMAISWQIATRLTAARYGVKLSPSFLVPSNWTGCLGVMNNYESLLPNKKALFDIPVARTASAYLTSVALAVSAFIADGSFNGGENALFIRPEFFYNNPLLSFVQQVIGPYTDELGNVLPNAVEGVGVPVDPLAFAGLLGIVVTSLNLLPIGRLEGGRVAQALFGRRTAALLSFGTSLLLGAGAVGGSVLCLAWGLFATFIRGGEEIPAQDEITPLGSERYAWGFVLAVVCLLTLFPNGGGTYSSSFLGEPFFRGGI